jgi:hypothetical protein
MAYQRPSRSLPLCGSPRKSLRRHPDPGTCDRTLMFNTGDEHQAVSPVLLVLDDGA